MPSKGEPHRPGVTGPGGAISRGTRYGQRVAREKREARLRIVPSEVRLYEEQGLLRGSMRAHAQAAAEECHALSQAQGGFERMSEQRQLATQDLGRLGIVVRALTAMFLENADPEIGTRISTIIGQRRALLALIGMERAQASVPDLAEYLRTRQDDATATITSTPNRPRSAEIAAHTTEEA